MTDEPIQMDNSAVQRSLSVTPQIGCHNVDTDVGPVHFCGASGIMTAHTTADHVPISVSLMIYMTGNQGNPGQGISVQLDPDAAREIADSLYRLANALDPVVPN